MSLDMNIGTKTIYSRRLNKGFSSKHPEGYPGRQALEEGQSTQRPKRNNNNYVISTIL